MEINVSSPDGQQNMQGQFGGRSMLTRVNTLREREDLEGGSNEVLERDVVGTRYTLQATHCILHTTFKGGRGGGE